MDFFYIWSLLQSCLKKCLICTVRVWTYFRYYTYLLLQCEMCLILSSLIYCKSFVAKQVKHFAHAGA